MLPPDGVRRATRLLCVLALLAIEVLFGAKVDNALSHCLGSDALTPGARLGAGGALVADGPLLQHDECQGLEWKTTEPFRRPTGHNSLV
jgi:hypothetical protein